MKDKTVLLILIDGLRHDYLSPADSPFLSSLCELNAHGAVRETFAFELRPAFFAGLHPEECGVANMFCFDPEGSPFKDIPIDDNDRVRISTEMRAEAKRRGDMLTSLVGASNRIPLALLHYFNFSEKRLATDPGYIPGKKTLFDYLRDDDKKWLWIAYPEHSGKTKDVLADFENIYTGDEDFIYLHFSELDWAGHEHGPFSNETKGTLKEIDGAIRQVYSTLNRNHKELNSIVFGDHGMAAVDRRIDVEAMLKGSGLELEKDYIYFLDSTQARFWFKDSHTKEKVLDLLKRVPEGRVLDDKDLERLRCRFEDNRFGELIFVADEGVGIFPNFFQDKPCNGLHGYLPEVEANWGKLIITGHCAPRALNEPVEMVDLFPTLLDMLGYEAPWASLTKGASASNAFDATILMPTYNRLDILKKNLAALEAQDYSKERFEVVVVDDGSIDGTQDYLEGFAKKTALRFTHISQKNSGPAAARNAGLRAAKGRVIVLIGDDMLPADDGFLSRHMSFHDEHPGLAHACLGHIEWSKDIKVTPLMEHITSAEGGQQFNIPDLLSRDPDDIDCALFWSSNISFKRRFSLTHGLFNDAIFKHAMWEDVDLGLRLEKAGLKLHFRKDCVVHHEHEITIRSFMERQRMVGWYSPVMEALGHAYGTRVEGIKAARLYSRLALEEMTKAIEAVEPGSVEGATKGVLGKVYNAALEYAAMTGYSEKTGNAEYGVSAIMALLHALTLVDEELEEHGKIIAQKDAVITQKNALITQKDALIAQKDAQLAEKHRQLIEKDRRIEELLNSLSWRVTAPLRKLGDFSK